jgi:hypothetical protein
MTVMSMRICAALMAAAASLPVASHAEEHSRTWLLAHLGANGLEKCRAFAKVRSDADQLQKAGNGALDAAQRIRLEQRLAAVKAMPPRSVTARTCGSPL